MGNIADINSRFESRLTAPFAFTGSPLTLKFWPWESYHVFRFMFNFIADTKFYWKINQFLCPENENFWRGVSVLFLSFVSLLCWAVSWCLLCPDKCLPVPDPDLITPCSMLKGTFCTQWCLRSYDWSITAASQGRYFIIFIRPGASVRSWCMRWWLIFPTITRDGAIYNNFAENCFSVLLIIGLYVFWTYCIINAEDTPHIMNDHHHSLFTAMCD